MKVIKPTYEILTPISEGGIQELMFIEKIGRVCYKSEDRITSDGESAKKFVKMLINHGHEAMIEHSTLSVMFTIDRGCCYDKTTKVLTKSGWKLFSDCTVDDEFLTLDDNDNPIYIKAKKIISDDYSGKMHHWKTTQIDLLVTPNHNMWVYDFNKRSDKTRTWKFIKSEDCNNSRYRFNKSSNRTNVDEIKDIVLDSVDVNRGFYVETYDQLILEANNFLELLGWWVTDGCINDGKNGSGNRITISQTKPEGRKRIRELLDCLSINYYETATEFRVNCPQLFKYLKDNFIKDGDNRKTYYLQLPRWMFKLGNDNIKAFLKGVIGGDGSQITGSDTFQIYTKSSAFAEDLVELYMLVGKCANIRSVPPRDRLFPNGIYSKCGEQYVVSEVKETKPLVNKNKIKDFEVYYDDKIYCVELEKYHKLYVLRNGKACWCGNSHEAVRHRLSSFAQESTRYVNYSKDKFGSEICVIDLEGGMLLDKKMSQMDADVLGSIYSEWLLAMSDAEQHYMNMIELGATPQIARSVLPNSTRTALTITANYREWRNIFRLRTALDAHPQIREVMTPLLQELKEKIPIIFDDIEI